MTERMIATGSGEIIAGVPYTVRVLFVGGHLPYSVRVAVADGPEVEVAQTMTATGAYAVLSGITWTEAREDVSLSSYRAQINCGNGHWTTWCYASSAAEGAERLRDLMESNGLRYSELHAHCADLAQGHVLTADNGRSFRVIRAARQNS